MELEERLARKRCITASSPDAAEMAAKEADNHYWSQALSQRATVCGYVADTGYDIEVVDSDGLTRAIVAPRLKETGLPCIASPETMSSGNTQHLGTEITALLMLAHQSLYYNRGRGQAAHTVRLNNMYII